MVSQAVNDGIFKFVLERNGIASIGSLPERVAVLVESGIVSEDCGKLSAKSGTVSAMTFIT
jgi:hypothetical protein